MLFWEDAIKKTCHSVINHGDDVNAADEHSQIALIWASKKGNVNAVNVVLSSGVYLNCVCIEGNTCLHYAADGDSGKEALQEIVNCGGKLNVTNNNKQTVLPLACQKGNDDAIYVLLHAGADCGIADVDGSILLHNAVYHNICKVMLQTTIDHGADVDATNSNLIFHSSIR